MANTSQQVFENIRDLFGEFETEHHGNTKVAKGRARAKIGEIKKLVTEYRKLSVQEGKS